MGMVVYNISNLVQKIMHTHADWRMTLIAQWPHIVGDIAQHACIERIEGEILIVGVHNAVWLQELYLLAPVLRQKINQALDQPRIKQIRFRHCNQHTVAQRKNTRVTTPPRTRPLNNKEQAALNTLRDAELGACLRNFLLRCQSEPK